MSARERADARWAASRQLVWRSMLFVPLNRPRFVASAVRCAADAVVLDLEDSVPAAEKPGARAALREAAEAIHATGTDVLVRVNPGDEDDLRAAALSSVCAVVRPKVEGPGDLREVAAALDAIESAAHLGIYVSIESAFGLEQLDAILGASERILAADLGEEDLAADLDIFQPTATGREFAAAQQLLILAARRAGIQAIGVSGFANYTDLDTWRLRATEARDMGFRGGGCIHPAQIAVLNETFSPSLADVERATAILAGWERSGGQAFAWEGAMIDAPIVERATALLQRADAIRRKDV